MKSVSLSAKGYDCAIITTDHKGIDYAAIVKDFPLVVDTRNATEGMEAPNVVKL